MTNTGKENRTKRCAYLIDKSKGEGKTEGKTKLKTSLAQSVFVV